MTAPRSLFQEALDILRDVNALADDADRPKMATALRRVASEFARVYADRAGLVMATDGGLVVVQELNGTGHYRANRIYVVPGQRVMPGDTLGEWV